MPVILVYLQPFRCNLLSNCVSQPKIAEKFTRTPYFRDSRSFKVIYVDTPKKLVANACLCLSATIFALDKPTVLK